MTPWSLLANLNRLASDQPRTYGPACRVVVTALRRPTRNSRSSDDILLGLMMMTALAGLPPAVPIRRNHL